MLACSVTRAVACGKTIAYHHPSSPMPWPYNYLVIGGSSGGCWYSLGGGTACQGGGGGEPQAGRHFRECRMCAPKGNVEHGCAL